MTMPPRHRPAVLRATLTLLGVWLGCAACPPSAQAQLMRPSTELRTMHAEGFDVLVQRSGRVDIITRAGTPIFQNAQPLIWLDGSARPDEMTIDGRATTRQEFRDRLGIGQEMRFEKKDTQWVIRVYPLRSFITVQAAYTNTGRRPVRVRALMPWTAGSRRDGGTSLGVDTVTGEVFGWPSGAAGPPEFAPAAESSMAWHALLVNPATGRSQLSGFLSHDRAVSTLRHTRRDKDNFGLLFEAISYYDPPIVLEPGERLDSEVLYLDLVEPDPLKALERFGQAYAISNGLRPQDHPAKLLARTVIDGHPDASVDALRESIGHIPIDGVVIERNHAQPFNLLDATWRDPIEPMLGALRAKGLRVGVRGHALTADASSDAVRDRPSWFIEDDASARRVLDVTAPGAYDYVRGLLGANSGLDLIDTGDDFSMLLHASAAPGNGPRTTFERMRFMREGLTGENGPHVRLLGDGAPWFSGLLCDGIRGGSAPVARLRQGPGMALWPHAEQLAAQARSFYAYPYMGRPVLDMPSMDAGDLRTWLTAAAMLGATVIAPESALDQSHAQEALLRAWPPLDTPARPLDLFERDHPRMWGQTIEGSDGEWHLLAVFNWNAALEETTHAALARMGLHADRLYTVFDFWHGQFLGMAQGDLRMTVAPGTVRLFALRQFRDRPMIAALDSPLTMGARHLENVTWDPVRRTLSGRTQPTPTPAALHVFVPEGFAVDTAHINGIATGPKRDGRTLVLTPKNPDSTPWTWTIQFRNSDTESD